MDFLETLYTVIAELHMPKEFFHYWTETTLDAKTPHYTYKLIELLQQYRLHLHGRDPSIPKSSTSCPAKQKQGISLTAVHLQKHKDYSVCHDGNHPLYLCAAFKAKSVEDRINTSSKLKVCTNCLSYNHFCRDCHSRRSCQEYGKRHHSSLHRQRPSSQTT